MMNRAKKVIMWTTTLSWMATYETEHGSPPRTRKPDMIVYSVRDTDEGKSYWNRVGVSFAHRDGRGSDLILESTPIDGRVTLREYRDPTVRTRNTRHHGS